MTIPKAWMPPASMQRIIVHWSAGAYEASALDRQHYHLIIEGDGNLVRGLLPISANRAPIRGNYAAHTLGCNTGSIGVSLACMAGAIERPADDGRAPMTRAQWEAGIEVVAALCRRYGIAVTDKTVLTHAEVQPNLGIKQRGKWDIARLPFDPGVVGARAVGDRLRREVAAQFGAQTSPKPAAIIAPTLTPAPTAMIGTVTATSLNLRRGASLAEAIVGTLRRGTTLAILDEDDGWYDVRAPHGHRGFVRANYVSIA